MRNLRMVAFTLAIAPTLAMGAQESPASPPDIERSFTLGPEVLASPNEDGGALRCEPSAALHGCHAIVAWNDSWGGQQGSQIGVAVGWSRSLDGGRTFEFGGYLPAPGEDEPPSGADSRLAVDAAGNFYLVVLSWYPTRKVLRLYTHHGPP